MKNEKTVLVVGLGKFGAAACKRLAELGQHVIAVDMDKTLVEEMASMVEVAAQLDATDIDALEKIGAREADVAIVAMGGDFGSEVLMVVLLHMLKIPYIIARAETPLHARVLKQVGASYVVLPEREIGTLTADRIVHPLLTKFSHLGGELMGEIIPLPEMIGKSVSELSFRKTYKAVAIMVKDKGNWRLIEVEEPILEGQKLLVVGHAGDVEKLMRGSDLNAGIERTFPVLDSRGENDGRAPKP